MDKDKRNIPDNIKKDIEKQWTFKTAKEMFVSQSNIDYLQDIIGRGETKCDIERYLLHFNYPYFQEIKYSDQKDILNVFNTVFIKTVSQVLNTVKLTASNSRLRNNKFGLTDDSFAGGFYSPEDYFYNNPFNKGPAWKRRIVNTRTYYNNSFKEAIFGKDVEENPAGIPFWRLYPYRAKWNIDNDVNPGLDQGGQVDRSIATNPTRYDMESLEKYPISEPVVYAYEVKPIGSV